jgi:hypothetical protein
VYGTKPVGLLLGLGTEILLSDETISVFFGVTVSFSSGDLLFGKKLHQKAKKFSPFL